MNFKEYIEDRCTPEPNSGCWLWLPSIGSHGYGNAYNGKTVVVAHRLSYETYRGVIPPGMDIDHKCRVRTCVNPDHLEAVTTFANRRRQAGYTCEATPDEGLCPKGHAGYSRDRFGKHRCLQCKRAIQKLYIRKRK